MVTSFLFAVLAIALRLRNDRTSRRRERLRRRWEPAMLEVLGGAAPPEELHARVRAGDGLDFLEFLLEYARLLRGEERRLVQRAAGPYLPLVVPMVKRGSAESRGHAVLLLARLGMPRYADAVAAALDDPSPIVSMIAARSLFRPGHEEYFPAVLTHLPRFTSWSRSFLASMLSGGGPRATPLLRTILADAGERPLVRAVASDALRQLNDLASVPIALALVEDLRDGTDRELVVGCLRILEHLGTHEHLTAVRARVDSTDPVIRAAAVSALGTIGGTDEIPMLQERLDDASFWVSLEAARGLLALGESATLVRIATSQSPWSMLARQVLSE